MSPQDPIETPKRSPGRQPGFKPAPREPKPDRKGPTNIRFDVDVKAVFEATGKGWQTRVNLALKDWLKTNDPNNLAKPQ